MRPSSISLKRILRLPKHADYSRASQAVGRDPQAGPGTSRTWVARLLFAKTLLRS